MNLNSVDTKPQKAAQLKMLCEEERKIDEILRKVQQILYYFFEEINFISILQILFHISLYLTLLLLVLFQGTNGFPLRSGKVENLEDFDAEFFRISRNEAKLMDPQLRILLEASFEAIVDAGESKFESSS